MRALLFLGVVRADAVVAYALSAAGDKQKKMRGLFSANLHGELLLSALSVHDLRRSDAWRLAAEGLPPKPGDWNEGVTEAVVEEAKRKVDVDEQKASAAFDALLSGMAGFPAGDDREWIVESVMPEVRTLFFAFASRARASTQTKHSTPLPLSLPFSVSP